MIGIDNSDTVYLTGGTGFIGSHLREALAGEDRDVSLLVRPDSAVSTRPNESVVRGDLTESKSFSLGDAGTVIHLAAMTDVEAAIESPTDAWNVNADGTLRLLEKARASQVRNFLYASTASVYGRPERLPITEDHPLKPVEPYAASKVAADRLVHAYSNTFGLPAMTVRIFNTFGPGQPMHNVVPAIVSQALTDDRIKLGNLTPSRDFVYVEDVVDALLTVLEHGEAGGVYNVGRGEETQIGELAGRVVNIVERDVEVVSTTEKQRSEDVEIPRHVSDPTKIRNLGWSPDFDLDDGLEATVDAFKGNTGPT